MSFNYNHVVLMGRLTQDPKIQTVAAQTRVTFVIAVDRPYKKHNCAHDTDFFNIVTWGKLAELGAKLLSKGSPVLVDGRIQIRPYEKNQQKFWFTEIVADKFELLELRYQKQEELLKVA